MPSATVMATAYTACHDYHEHVADGWINGLLERGR